MQHLAVAFETFQKQQLFANKKCLFGRAEIDYLGHIISRAGVATNPAKIQVMRSWLVLQSLKELRSFLGLLATIETLCSTMVLSVGF